MPLNHRWLFIVLVILMAWFGAYGVRAAEPPAQTLLRFNYLERIAVALIFQQYNTARTEYCKSHQVPMDQCGNMTQEGVYKIEKVEPPK